tara:strand:+ start:9 stop:131 length:123 start_codon:yes stop_codon:yes gene_type:complete
MNLAVIGSGGREHTICYKLKQSTKNIKEDIGWRIINNKKP